jgi:hypothetical protein
MAVFIGEMRFGNPGDDIRIRLRLLLEGTLPDSHGHPMSFTKCRRLLVLTPRIFPKKLVFADESGNFTSDHPAGGGDGRA